jgi:predicted amidophosphoribosyltransferase
MGRYEGSLREAVHRFKFLGLDQLARPFADGMARRLKCRAGEPLPWDLIVPIPRSQNRILFPPRNPPDLLAQELSFKLRIPLQLRLLRKCQATPPQTMLGRRERLANPIGTMGVTRGKLVRGKTVLIVDDILTTGATCSAAARALRSVGAHACHVVVIAR